MDNNKQIEKALDLIKGKKKNQARNLLLEVLNTDSGNDIAWYLLSFTLPTKDRQIYALKQALKNNPYNLKAKSLLSRLTDGNETAGPQAEVKIGESKETPFLEDDFYNLRNEPNLNFQGDDVARDFGEEEVAEPELPAFLEKESDEEIENFGDLLSRRIPFENEVDKQKFDKDSSDIEESIEKLRATVGQENGKKGISESKKRIKSIHNKLPEVKRKKIRRILLFLLILGISAGAYYFYRSGISFSDIRKEAVDFTTDILSSTNTPVPTSTMPLPSNTPVPSSTKTPVPTSTKEASFPPTKTPLETPRVLNSNVEEKTSLIQNQIDNLRGLASNIEPEKYLVTSQYLQDVLRNVFNTETIISNALLEAEILNLFGLRDKTYDIQTHYINNWVEARGGLYLPLSNAIYFTGLNFNALEQYVFAQEYAQFLLDQNYDFKDLGAYPDCFESGQLCQAAQALIKGEALFLANMWASESLSISDQNGIANLFPKSYFIIENTPPEFALLDLDFQYNFGYDFIEEIYLSGGWEAVDSLYLEPPKTTEQIMHPEKYLLGEGSMEFQDIQLLSILGEDWDEIKVSDFGEWRTYLLLAHGNKSSFQISVESALSAAEGWGGDQYRYFKNGANDEYAISLHWIMDSETDLQELEKALTDHLNLKYGSQETILGNTYCWVGEISECVKVFGNELFWLQASNELITESIIHQVFDN